GIDRIKADVELHRLVGDLREAADPDPLFGNSDLAEGSQHVVVHRAFEYRRSRRPQITAARGSLRLHYGLRLYQSRITGGRVGPAEQQGQIERGEKDRSVVDEDQTAAAADGWKLQQRFIDSIEAAAGYLIDLDREIPAAATDPGLLGQRARARQARVEETFRHTPRRGQQLFLFRGPGALRTQPSIEPLEHQMRVGRFPAEEALDLAIHVRPVEGVGRGFADKDREVKVGRWPADLWREGARGPWLGRRGRGRGGSRRRYRAAAEPIQTLDGSVLFIDLQGQ